MTEHSTVEILHIDNSLLKGKQGLFGMDLIIPPYQRPYKWTDKNIADLLDDINIAVQNAARFDNYKYRIGTIILHKDDDGYNIVDGQQRIISLVLLKLFLTKGTFSCKLLDKNFKGDKVSQNNIYNNYHFIKDWFLLKGQKYEQSVAKALIDTLEVVVVCVKERSEAFQLFDSQNTRGRALDPHDLLKAYHLREMKEYPYEMQHAVTKWEAVDTQKIRDLFALYLFPIRQWAKGVKSYPFSVKEIDIYKGIEETSPYSYAKRASKAMPYFQIPEPFIAGGDFFEMVEHYLNLWKNMKAEMETERFNDIRNVLKWNEDDDGTEKKSWAGFRYTKNLFYCAVLCYYDKFKNFDEQAIKKLFSWAFMLRVDMEKLGFDTINKYAVGDEENVKYTNRIAIFSKIINARRHNEISNIQIKFRKDGAAEVAEWNELYNEIRRLNGYEQNDMIEKIIGCANIFNEADIKYIIPLYQRAFAWKDDEIKQLIEDIYYFKEKNYYIGSLIVSKNSKTNEYEVIDGQQRLTALFLLLKTLKVDGVQNILTFACREKSNRTLQHLDDDILLEKDIEESLKQGKRIIFDIISGKTYDGQDFDQEAFKTKMDNVILFRIEVPKNTDLNRYFEIMNTRGEQLERHDIVKASLMSEISGDENQMRFARIWDACRDMNGYVPMHFINTEERKELFGYNWNWLQSFSLGTSKKKQSGQLLIADIIKNGAEDNADGEVKEGRIRFESIISFPYFLIHVLKVLIHEKGIRHVDGSQKIIDVLLDDKKLTDTFDSVIKNGVINGKKISDDKKLIEQFSVDFIKCLLKCRCLFDKAIIKREYVNDNSDGEWSLKQLEVSGQGGNKKPWYKDTVFQSGRSQGNTLKHRHSNILMLQACLRVSYTSPKVMHWITELLIWLIDDANTWDEYEWKINRIVATAVKDDYLNKGVFNLGVGTPHIVFNYLDYLLWRDDKTKYKGFVFEFRNSVEHWYPRNPSANTFENWSHDDGVNDFGNLCIIQRNVNSKFSNLHPTSKKGTFKDAIQKGSLKLRLMSDETITDQNWKDKACKEHEQAMLDILKNACEQANQ